MTTTVRVEAHCPLPDTMCKITITGKHVNEEYHLKDGDSRDFYVFDDRVITVTEVSIKLDPDA